MSSIKDHLFDVQEMQAEEWIRERLSDDSLTEDSEEWQNLLLDYAAYQEHLSDEAEWISELKWLKENGAIDIFENFNTELDSLKNITNKSLSDPFRSNENIIVKMAFSYSVTLLEAFLGDTLKAIISENPKYLQNAITRIPQIKEKKFSLLELSKLNMDVSALAIKCISEMLFHKVIKVLNIYEQTLGVKLNIDTSEIVKIVDIRHDIVHRNGYTKSNELIDIMPHDLYEAIRNIKMFAAKLQKIIDSKTAT